MKTVKLELQNPNNSKAVSKFIAQHLKDGYKLRLVDRVYNAETKKTELIYEATEKNTENNNDWKDC